jgi:8-oxo-dGTP pyrophosphatase MutT (NUDIX family)
MQLNSVSGDAVKMSQQRPNRVSKPRQSAVIPLRRTTQGVQVCLIRRKDSVTWGIPKGFIDPGDTREQAALKEAGEEAGLDGQLIGECIGTYDYEKRGANFIVAVYLMDVLEERSTWREMRFRERRWGSLEEAALLLTGHPVRPLLDRVRGHLAMSKNSAD